MNFFLGAFIFVYVICLTNGKMTKYIPDVDRDDKNTNNNIYNQMNVEDNDNANNHALSNVKFGKPTTPTSSCPNTATTTTNGKNMETIYNKLKTLSNENVARGAIRYGGQEKILNDPNSQYTLFVPTDLAFEFLPDGIYEYLKSSPRDMSGVIRAHIVSGKYTSANLHDAMTISSLDGSKHHISWMMQSYNENNNNNTSTNNNIADAAPGYWTIDGVRIVEADINADNGVIHKIDGILSSVLVDVPKNSELADALHICKEKQFNGFQLADCVRNVVIGLGAGNVKERPDVNQMPEY